MTDAPRITLDLLKKYDRPGPATRPTRPPSNSRTPSVPPSTWTGLLWRIARRSSLLYAHLPFGEHSVHPFAGATSSITQDAERRHEGISAISTAKSPCWPPTSRTEGASPSITGAGARRPT
jgi:hypothetical protein